MVFDLAVGRYLTHRSLLGFVLRSLPAELAIRRRFSSATRRTIENSLPAHLHINVDADFRSAGIGRQLIEAFLASLREQGIPGVHLYCGAAPLEFYRRLGFHQLGAIDFNGSRIFALAMNLIVL
jgi:GNAT superfamily N-acetyltransferase